MEPSEVEFIAEREMIKIVPNFSSGQLLLLQGDIGPFKPGLPLEVPLWMATHLRQRQKCRILQPEWMDLELLEEVKEREKDPDNPLFSKLPNDNLFVVNNLIMDAATSDLSNADDIKTVIKDIWDIRQSKLRKVVNSFVLSGSLRATLNNVQLIELNSIRPLLPHTLDQILRLEMAGADSARVRSQMSQNSATADRSLMGTTMY